MLGGVMANSADVEAEQSVEARVSGSHALRGNPIDNFQLAIPELPEHC